MPMADVLPFVFGTNHTVRSTPYLAALDTTTRKMVASSTKAASSSTTSSKSTTTSTVIDEEPESSSSSSTRKQQQQEQEQEKESSLSVVPNQGLTATTSSSAAVAAAASASNQQHPSHQQHGNANGIGDGHIGGGSIGGSSNVGGDRHRRRSKTTSSTTPQPTTALDFIGTSHAVKNLFSIPYHTSDEALCIAVHNLDGTLMIDDTVISDEEVDYDNHHDHDEDSGTDEEETMTTTTKTTTNPLSDPNLSISKQGVSSSTKRGRLPPSSQSLALALAPANSKMMQTDASPSGALLQSNGDAFSLLNKMIQSAQVQEDNEVLLPHKRQQQQEMQNSLASNSSSSAMNKGEWKNPKYGSLTHPTSVREYVEWNFQDMNLLVGSDALIVRPDPDSSSAASASSSKRSTSTALAIRVEEADYLKRILAKQHEEITSPSSSSSAKEDDDATTQQLQQQLQQQNTTSRSYIQALMAAPPTEDDDGDGDGDGDHRQTNQEPNNNNDESSMAVDETNDEGIDHKKSLGLDKLHLHTCIIPSPGPLGGLLDAKQSLKSESSRGRRSSLSAREESASPVCIVLDAYLDNLMANVPQLALCLEEKGLIQSVKLLQTEEIPSMMMHPTTLDTSKPIGQVARPSGDDPTEELFSPDIMEMNASALLRFLKANCTTNNATYLLRREPGAEHPNNIQLYDISSISTQRQRKWIWWLATMSYRFALRLRHLESQNAVPMHKRLFRDRQRSLYQTTLDLLQDLLDMDGNAHESLVASVREHMADTFLGEAEDVAAESSGSEDDTPSSSSSSSSPPPIISSSTGPANTSSPRSRQVSPPKSRHGDAKQRKRQSHSGIQQPYARISIDALNKAHDHLVHGIKMLWPLLEKQTDDSRTKTASSTTTTKPKRRKRRSAGSSVQPSEEETETSPSSAMVLQLFGLHYKVVNISLRLAEHHLQNYYSSSAMQALRNAARRLADAESLLTYIIDVHEHDLVQRLQLQYTWLWEHCGHFARSFASDELWRERGHACGDDVISVLRDVEAAFSSTNINYRTYLFPRAAEDRLLGKTNGMASLYSLSAVVVTPQKSTTGSKQQQSQRPQEELQHRLKSVSAAKSILAAQRQLQRDKRQVLVASCISYSRAILSYHNMTGEDISKTSLQRSSSSSNSSGKHSKNVIPMKKHDEEKSNKASSSSHNMSDPRIVDLLRQRLGDASNETGKVLLDALRTLLTSNPPQTKKDQTKNVTRNDTRTQQGNSNSNSNNNNNNNNEDDDDNDKEKGNAKEGEEDKEEKPKQQDDTPLIAEVFLDSAQFWFLEGLEAFDSSRDLRNVALLRCNLCQCYKLRANSTFASTSNNNVSSSSSSSSSHAERCLQEAANHLQAAHVSLGVRDDVDPMTWDMVSQELAATFLVLGVRRRQSKLGGGTVPVILFHSLRLSPGEERSIIEPMEKALKIYQQSKNLHQAAAVQYQLALTYSKIWTIQRDEVKTREKLSLAFQYYNQSYAYFHNNLQNNEPTFILLCLDLASLYASAAATTTTTTTGTGTGEAGTGTGSASEECLKKALSRCLDTYNAFSQQTIDNAMMVKTTTKLPTTKINDAVTSTASTSTASAAPTKIRHQWLQQMETLALSVDERVFKLLRNLVKLNNNTTNDTNNNHQHQQQQQDYKELYRHALTAKLMVTNKNNDKNNNDDTNNNKNNDTSTTGTNTLPQQHKVDEGEATTSDSGTNNGTNNNNVNVNASNSNNNVGHSTTGSSRNSTTSTNNYEKTVTTILNLHHVLVSIRTKFQ